MGASKLTVLMDEETIHKARVLAKWRQMSVHELIEDLIRDQTDHSQPLLTRLRPDVYDLLRSAPSGAVVLERIARGAGATNWFVCRDATDLDRVSALLHPSSCVSFYYDDRISYQRCTEQVRQEILRFVRDDLDCVVGVLAPDGVYLTVDFIAGESELEDFLEEHDRPEKIYFGRFPGRDNDGLNGITFTLPDPDGVIRAHPY